MTKSLPRAAVVTQDIDCLTVTKSVSLLAVDYRAVGAIGTDERERSVRQLDSEFAYLSIGTGEVVQTRWHQWDAQKQLRDDFESSRTFRQALQLGQSLQQNSYLLRHVAVYMQCWLGAGLGLCVISRYLFRHSDPCAHTVPILTLQNRTHENEGNAEHSTPAVVHGEPSTHVAACEAQGAQGLYEAELL